MFEQLPNPSDSATAFAKAQPHQRRALLPPPVPRTTLVQPPHSQPLVRLPPLALLAVRHRLALAHCLEANGRILTNFEVLQYLRSMGETVDPMGCLDQP
ncbi:hypothetical protein Taro_048154 [Colocasia esculenta]|uniref:Uncharacterized protein n=1 Tax=Colocasia esculenta TaxID=4460 RepID=A0A843WXD3_COLES|nr:hypothetical protein [Colocasia esculenta]